MRYIHDTTEFHTEGASAVTLGKFDGLHRGHQKLLREILRLQKEGLYGIVFAIAPEDRTMLFTPEEKRNRLEAYGIDCMIRCPFIPEVLSMAPEKFVANVLCDQLNARYIVVGTDFRFGYQRSGDVETLRALQKKYGYTLIVIEKERYRDREISSTYIREALSGADMEIVTDLMGGYYLVEGTVLHGHQLGRTLGMPTINLRPDPYKLLPPPGVYYSDVEFMDAPCRSCHGITNIGFKPTVDGSFLGVETYLYDVHDDLYDRKVRVFLREFRRPERKFVSVEELQKTMEQDIRSGRDYFGGR
ncbi:MAG: riboflavin biosynthesis protein RibF [Lachnospiraceae bacterium]|nr:riboflavin biosynthesis protein RibF [Lachnospiraceae bacterium]